VGARPADTCGIKQAEIGRSAMTLGSRPATEQSRLSDRCRPTGSPSSGSPRTISLKDVARALVEALHQGLAVASDAYD